MILTSLIYKIHNPNPFDDTKVMKISKDFIDLLKSDDELMDEFMKQFNHVLRQKKLKQLKDK